MFLLLLLVYIIRSNGRTLESWQISGYYTLITIKQRHVEESKSFSEYPEYYHWVLFIYWFIYSLLALKISFNNCK